MYLKYFKRFIDIVFVLLLLPLSLPIVFLCVVIIKIESHGPVFILQERLGKNGKIFLLFKLRSLKENKMRKENQVSNDHPDMTRIGKFMRRYKLDELPQIINVLIGDMSIVGPRPCLPTLRKQFDKNAEFRLLVKPGLTGWAQVNGNINNSWDIRWQYDRFYVENLSFSLDVRIIYKTIFVVIFGE